MGGVAQAVAELGAAPELITGTLRVFGDWFGRPYDNVHVATAVAAERDTLVIDFEGREQLRVAGPAGWSVGPAGLVIAHARRVEWRWYLYGRPVVAGNRRTIEHSVEDGKVRARTDAPWPPPTWTSSLDEPAVEILR